MISQHLPDRRSCLFFTTEIRRRECRLRREPARPLSQDTDGNVARANEIGEMKLRSGFFDQRITNVQGAEPLCLLRILDSSAEIASIAVNDSGDVVGMPTTRAEGNS